MELDRPLGSRQNKIFPLSETLGAIEGVQAIRASILTTDLDEISKFHYLPEGAEIEFETARTIDVLVFGMASSEERGDYGVMYAHSVALRPGGRLSGPVAWHPRAPMKDEPFFEDGEEKFALGFVGVLSLLFAFMPLPLSFLVIAAATLYGLLHGGAEWIALRTIEKHGRAQIYGPSEHLWD